MLTLKGLEMPDFILVIRSLTRSFILNEITDPNWDSEASWIQQKAAFITETLFRLIGVNDEVYTESRKYFSLVECSGINQARKLKSQQTVLKRQDLNPFVESRYINTLQEYQSTKQTCGFPLKREGEILSLPLKTAKEAKRWEGEKEVIWG